MRRQHNRLPLNRAIRRAALSVLALLVVSAFSWFSNRDSSAGAAGDARASSSTDAASTPRQDAGVPDAVAAGSQTGGQTAARTDTTRTGARRDLRADERLGGHTLARHVAKTDEELAARLRRERQISAASTYTDMDTAERVVGAALAQSKKRLDAWVQRTGPRPNLVLNYAQAGGPPIGRSLERDARTATPCDRALVVLRWDERDDRWFVLTSYPEARR
jgi:hypothetical protein